MCAGNGFLTIMKLQCRSTPDMGADRYIREAPKDGALPPFMAWHACGRCPVMESFV
jgi:hypothetical protein